MNRNGEEKLREVMLRNSLPVAFIGSGVSTNFGDWSKFLKDLVNRANEERTPENPLDFSDDISLDMQLHIADDARSKITNNGNAKGNFYSYMNDYFNNKEPIPHVFYSIIHAPFAFYITINYDQNIETAYQKIYDTPLKVVTPANISEALTYMYDEPQKPFLLKLHGSVNNAGDDFIVGYNDYRRIIYNNRHLRYVLASIFATHRIVFIGCGHRDPHITRYMEYELSVLPELPTRHFSFGLKQELEKYDPLRSYLKRLKIKEIEIEKWPEISTILDKCTFLRMRDHYQQGRQQYREGYNDFIKNGKQERAREALMYLYASWTLGNNDDIDKLWEVLNKNDLLKKHIEKNPTFDLMLGIAAGQMFKRRCSQLEAKEQFDRVEVLALGPHDETMLSPLRALGLRYAGIFYFQEEKNNKKAEELFIEAGKILGDGFEDEKLDLQKWQIYLSKKDVPQKLFDLAEEAKKNNYKKNAAWCQYGAIDYMYRNDRKQLKGKKLDDSYSRLDSVLLVFEELQHMEGAGATHCLYAKILHEIENKNNDIVRKHLMAAQAMAYHCNDKRLIEKCERLQASLNNK